MNTRRIVTATLGCVVFASVAAFVGVTKAEAYTWSGYGGSTGAVSVPVTVGHSGNPYASSGGPGPDPYLETGVLRVYRSPAYSGRQTISAEYRVKTWGVGAWVLSKSYPQSRQVNPGFRADFGSWNIQIGPYHEFYQVQWKIRWLRPDGTQIAWAMATLDRSGDYRCGNEYLDFFQNFGSYISMY